MFGTEAAYRQTGQVDYRAAIRAWYGQYGAGRGRRAVLLNQGMWGGFAAIDAARDYVAGYLRGSRGAAARVARVRAARRPGRGSSGCIWRRGDFGTPVESAVYWQAWNVGLPLRWYADVCRGLRDLLGRDAQFLVRRRPALRWPGSLASLGR